jgi:hypothetical protein
MPKKLVKKCFMCERRPVFSVKSIYCLTCSHFSARMSDERFPPKTREYLEKYVRKNDYLCYYTKIELDVFDESSPWFLEFDHLVPGNPKKIVITSAWINEFKGDLTFKEFKGSIVQLYNYWFKGIKIKKKKFRYWYRLKP